MRNIKIHNKLVRNKIPDIIEADGRVAFFHILSYEEYINELDRNLIEECSEYCENKSIEELADIIEVIYAIAEVKGFSIAELDEIRNKKENERGKFNKRIFLEKVED